MPRKGKRAQGAAAGAPGTPSRARKRRRTAPPPASGTRSAAPLMGGAGKNRSASRRRAKKKAAAPASSGASAAATGAAAAGNFAASADDVVDLTLDSDGPDVAPAPGGGCGAGAGAGAGSGAGAPPDLAVVVWDSDSDVALDPVELYQATFEGHRCCPTLTPAALRTHTYRYAAAGATASQQRKRMRTLAKAFKSMPSTLPQHARAAVFVRYDATRPYLIQALLTGPQGTPYDSGCFLFNIMCPSDYPRVPPQVTLVTTGGGTVRFNPNLYASGKVCLSLLGTWTGPGWIADRSTLLQVLISIQSLIMVEEPYYNEPGRALNTPVLSRIDGNGGWERLRVQSIRHAMIDMILHPPSGFEDIIRTHFFLRRSHIRASLRKWKKDAAESPTPGHAAWFKRESDVLRGVLDELQPTPIILAAEARLQTRVAER